MKRFFIILLLICFYQFSNAQNFEIVKDEAGNKMLKGIVPDSVLLADTASFGWFEKNNRIYKPQQTIVKSFADKKDGFSFIAFFGTWCDDSNFVIPRLCKLLSKAGIEKDSITLFALDKTKKDDANFASGLNVSRVPTIIVRKNGKEIGRVIEYGVTGRFDEELASILNKSN